MTNENCQKIKLLKLVELLRHETDEQNPMRTNEICKRLSDMNISCDRRTLARDMKDLNEQGYEVMCVQFGRANAYYIADRSFSTAELKILIDAVQGASFVTDKKTAELVDKLADLSGSHRGELLKRNLVCFNNRKHTNESIYYNIEQLETALQKKKKVSFTYFHLDEKRNKIYHTDDGKHTVEPIALVYSDDNYYLTCYNPDEDNNFNYRVDRMENVEIEKETVSEKARIRTRSIAKYTAEVFKMYGGETEKVTLEFTANAIESVYDKFGENTKIRKIGDDSFMADVDVQISPTFFGWLFQFAGRMKILSPKSVADKYHDLLKTAVEDGE